MIAIVGGGLSGLAVALRLQERGLDFVLMEATARPGGVIRSAVVEGRVLDLGPQRTRLTPRVAGLVERLGLAERVVRAPRRLPLWIYARGGLRRVPLRPAELIRTNLLTPAGKARLLLEPFTAGLRPQESAAEFFIRKFGHSAYRDMLGPLYGGLYGSDPARMPAAFALARALRDLGIGRSVLLSLLRRGVPGRAIPEACSFQNGMQELTDALYERVRERVRLDAPVRSLHREEGGGWRVETDDGGLSADVVVLSVPADAAARVLERSAPAAAGRLGGLRYNQMAVVHLHSEARLEGLGYQVSFSEELATRGVTWNASLFAREGVYTAYLGGARRPEVPGWPDQRLAHCAAQEFERVTGASARPLSVSRTRMPAWDHSWRALAGFELPPGLLVCANWQGRPGIPGRLAAAAGLASGI